MGVAGFFFVGLMEVLLRNIIDFLLRTQSCFAFGYAGLVHTKAKLRAFTLKILIFLVLRARAALPPSAVVQLAAQ